MDEERMNQIEQSRLQSIRFCQNTPSAVVLTVWPSGMSQLQYLKQYLKKVKYY